MARLTSGDELRKRLEELDGRTQACSHENGDHREFVEGPRCKGFTAISRGHDLSLFFGAGGKQQQKELIQSAKKVKEQFDARPPRTEKYHV
jgi:hypothetical protein